MGRLHLVALERIYRGKDTLQDLNVLERSQGKIRKPLWSFWMSLLCPWIATGSQTWGQIIRLRLCRTNSCCASYAKGRYWRTEWRPKTWKTENSPWMFLVVPVCREDFPDVIPFITSTPGPVGFSGPTCRISLPPGLGWQSGSCSENYKACSKGREPIVVV